MTTTSKKCLKCGEVKGFGEFGSDRTKKDGKRSYCKACGKEYHRQWHKQNREKKNERSRQWREQNRGKHKEICRQWREQNREKYNEYQRQWREQNSEKYNEYNRQRHARQKAMREFFRMHKAMAQITEALQQYMHHDYNIEKMHQMRKDEGTG